MDKEAVKKLANLSRLELSEDEIAEYADEFSSILSYVDSLKEAVSETESSDLIFENSNNRNVIKEDENPNMAGKNTQKLLNEAPNSENNYFKVKKIL